MDCFNVSWLKVVVVACCSLLILFCFDLLFQLIEFTRECIEEYLLRTFFKMVKITELKKVLRIFLILPNLLTKSTERE